MQKERAGGGCGGMPGGGCGGMPAIPAHRRGREGQGSEAISYARLSSPPSSPKRKQVTKAKAEEAEGCRPV